jgi:calcineurin-like phosphoesterase family protein
MNEIYFVSDTHFHHRNIIRYSNRPFDSVEEMNEALIVNWNSRVKPTDTVYHLGDVGFCNVEKLDRIIARLNGRIHLTPGNHDKPAKRITRWASVEHYREITIDRQLIVLLHYGMRVWNRSHHGSIQLYGHSHGNLPGNSQSCDVGVDCWNYFPVNLEEIKARLATLPKYVGYALQAGGGDHHLPEE